MATDMPPKEEKKQIKQPFVRSGREVCETRRMPVVISRIPHRKGAKRSGSRGREDGREIMEENPARMLKIIIYMPIFSMTAEPEVITRSSMSGVTEPEAAVDAATAQEPRAEEQVWDVWHGDAVGVGQ